MAESKAEEKAPKREFKDKDASGKQAAPKKAATPFQQSQQAGAAKFARRKGKEKENFRGIVRLVGKDVDGHMNIFESMRRVKGVGANLASNLGVIASAKLGIPFDELIGNLGEEQFAKLEDLVRLPQKYGVSAFLLNRRKDADTGETKNLVMADLTFTTRQDVVKETESRSYRGWRHGLGQKVRGQHTRTTGRSGMTVGVLKKAIKAQKAAAATGAQEKSAGGKKEEAKK